MRCISACCYQTQKERIFNKCLYQDDMLNSCEEKDYLQRLENKRKGYSMDDFHQKQHTFGTIAIITDLKDKTPQDCFNYYKNRGQIETMIDAFKNTIDADRTYIQYLWQ